MKTYFLIERISARRINGGDWVEVNEENEVVFEVQPDGTVDKIFPILATTDLNESDLDEWLTEDIELGCDSCVRGK